jgi:peptidoglycan-associated lipoprotein
MWFASLILGATVLFPIAAEAQATSEFSQNVKEVFFPFDVYSRVTNPEVLDVDAGWLKQHADTHFWIAGYADIRGDIFYNLVLSYRRAQFVKASLTKRGVSESQIGYSTGWGKLFPVCGDHDEACFERNRRVDVVLPELLPQM